MPHRPIFATCTQCKVRTHSKIRHSLARQSTCVRSSPAIRVDKTSLLRDVPLPQTPSETVCVLYRAESKSGDDDRKLSCRVKDYFNSGEETLLALAAFRMPRISQRKVITQSKGVGLERDRDKSGIKQPARLGPTWVQAESPILR